MAKKTYEQNSPLKVLAGPEIETLADYLGQGALAVSYVNETTGRPNIHRLKNAYNDIIAQSLNGTNPLCLSTDSNRSKEDNMFPKRTSIEFRSGPKQPHTQELLHLTKAYSDWLIEQKTQLRHRQFKDYNHPTRNELNTTHCLNISDFIDYYNNLKNTKVKLTLNSPHAVFDPKNSGPDFEFKFPKNAIWVLQLSYADLAPQYNPVFTAQYNLSLPIGCIFDPQTKNSFPIIDQFALLHTEKEIAADFNESRPHPRLIAYEQQVFATAVTLADH